MKDFGGLYLNIKHSKKGLSTTVAIGAIVLVIIIVIAAWYLMAPKPKVEALIIGTTDSVETNIDPVEAYDFFGWNIIQMTGSALVRVKAGAPNGASEKDIEPSLAEDWSKSSDGKTWTFNLRKGVKYSDGTEFNATHVKYSIDRGMSLAVPEGAYVGIGFSDIIESVEVTGTYQVKFHLKAAFGPFLPLMAAAVPQIVNPKYAPFDSTVNYVEGDARASCPNDLGPYILTNWTRVAGKDSEMRFEANPNFWEKGVPKTKKIVIKFYADATGLATAIDAGDIDIAFRQLKVADIESFKTKTNVKVWTGPSIFIQYLVFQERIEPFDDARVRRAVGAALNRSTLTKTVFLGQASNLYSMIPDGMSWHTDAYKTLGDANYTFTKNTLNDATIYGGPYTETNKLVVDLWYETSGHYPQSADQATVIESSLEASGVITVNMHGLDWPAYRQKRGEETMPVYIYGWYPDYVDPDNYVYPFLHSSGSSWLHNNYNNTNMDKLAEDARFATDAATRENLYGQVQKLMVQDAPIVSMFQGSQYVVTKPNVKGVYLDISYVFRPWLIYAE